MLAYLAFTTALIAVFWNRLPEAPVLLAAHAAAVIVLAFEIRRPNPTSWVFRHWYPLPYVAYCFREMALLIPAVRGKGTATDVALARLDYHLWGAHPTVWLERVQTPALTELLQTIYTLFVPAVLLVAFLLWKRGRYREFQYYAFLIALGFLVSYVGYLLAPARGPRFLLSHLQTVPLQGLWLFGDMQMTLDRLESAHFDCFPSGHTELTLLACWGSRMVSKYWFRGYLFYTPLLIFATVYLRYHYSVDVFAGVAVATILTGVAPATYRKLSKEA